MDEARVQDDESQLGNLSTLQPLESAAGTVVEDDEGLGGGEAWDSERQLDERLLGNV
jgi:hypothetical protein